MPIFIRKRFRKTIFWLALTMISVACLCYLYKTHSASSDDGTTQISVMVESLSRKSSDAKNLINVQNIVKEWPCIVENRCRNHTFALWLNQPATLANMLGGQESEADLQRSTEFLEGLLITSDVQRNRALDCGSGIGRISKNLLLPRFESVDAVDATQNFLLKLPDYVGEERKLNIGQLFWSPLEDFSPASNTYDLIWCQWVLMYLSNEELLSFLKRARIALTKRGIMVIKENVSFGDDDLVFRFADDGNVLRSFKTLGRIFSEAGFEIIAGERQDPNSPLPADDLLYALKSRQDSIIQ